MARIFITGSTQGLGFMAASELIAKGHDVVVHARHHQAADAVKRSLIGVRGIVEGDVVTMRAIRSLADQANDVGPFDAIIHNVGIGYRENRRIATEDGLSHVFAINTVAPFMLTALMERPRRLIYLSSGLHRGASAGLDDLSWTKRRWNGTTAYSESKFQDVLLAFAIARRWPEVFSNALEPGWVATRMGGKGAPDDLDQGHRTQVWLAVSDDAAAKVSGEYFYHQGRRDPHPLTRDTGLQDRFVEALEAITGVRLRV